MPTNLYNAHKQWVTRSPDERFASIDALLDFTGKRKRDSVEDRRQLRSLRLYASRNDALNLNGHLPRAILTNWAFSQLCQRVGAPAGYLRSLPAEVAAECIEYGMGKSSDECNILTRKNAEAGEDSAANLAAAFTSGSYSRIWDYDVLTELQSAIAETTWRTPPSSSDGPCGLYASDRDMFVFMVNEENPVEIGTAKLGRGFFVWNSETGAATFGLTTFLYNYVCGNHIVWGAEHVNELRIVHRHRALDRFYRDALPILNHFVESRELSDSVSAAVSKAMTTNIGGAPQDVLNWFSSRPFTRYEVIAGYQAGLNAGDDVSTVWGMVQGLTAAARTLQHADKRVNLERRAGALLS